MNHKQEYDKRYRSTEARQLRHVYDNQSYMTIPSFQIILIIGIKRNLKNYQHIILKKK